MKTEQQLQNKQLKEKLSENYKNNGIQCIKNINQNLNSIFMQHGKNANHNKHTYDYSLKKATYYKEKYDINIMPYQYHPKGFQELIKTHLDNPNIEKPVGFFAFNIHQLHIDAIIVHKGKIFVFQTYSHAANIIRNLELYFDTDKIYIQKIPNDTASKNYTDYFSQNDYISCPVFALKYMKEAMRDNAKLLDMAQLIPSDNQKYNNHEFIIHPYVERYSQSEKHFNKAKKNWNLHHQSQTSDELLSKADAWRQTHDKTRMMYYLLKDLDYDGIKEMKNSILK